MQDEIEAEYPGALQIGAVNAVGHDSGVALMNAEGDLPLCQDVVEQDVWAAWGAVWRDVFVLDEENVTVTVYNLTSHNLAVQANYDELKQIFIDEITDGESLP